MNIPVYFNTKARLWTLSVITILFLMPPAAFLFGYLFNQRSIEVATLCGLFGLIMSGATTAIMWKTFAKYFRNKPAFVLKDEVIETSSGNLICWNWFEKGVVFSYENVKMLGLRKKKDVKKAGVGNSATDFNAEMFGFPFAIQFNQFSMSERELIKLFQTKLPITVSQTKFKGSEKHNLETID